MSRTTGRWLSIDPGETTGWALWDGKDLVDAGQDPLVPFIDLVADGVGLAGVPQQGPFEGVERLVMEEFRIYPWKCEELEFDEVRTARGIGALEFIGRQAGLEVVLQPAKIKEAAQTAGARDLFRHPLYENRHQNDAIMHGFNYIVTVMLAKRVKLPGGGTAIVMEG